MKLSVQLNKSLEEPSVLVEYAAVDREVETILAALNGLGTDLVGRKGKELVRIPAAEVLYCESVDGNAFLHTSETVIESALRLSDIEQRARHTGFVRVSRTMLVNLYRVTGLRPFPKSCWLFEAADNGSLLNNVPGSFGKYSLLPGGRRCFEYAVEGVDGEAVFVRLALRRLRACVSMVAVRHALACAAQSKNRFAGGNRAGYMPGGRDVPYHPVREILDRVARVFESYGQRFRFRREVPDPEFGG